MKPTAVSNFPNKTRSISHASSENCALRHNLCGPRPAPSARGPRPAPQLSRARGQQSSEATSPARCHTIRLPYAARGQHLAHAARGHRRNSRGPRLAELRSDISCTMPHDPDAPVRPAASTSPRARGLPLAATQHRPATRRHPTGGQTACPLQHRLPPTARRYHCRVRASILYAL